MVSRTGAAGALVEVQFRLTGEASDLVAGAQTDIAYDPTRVTVPAVAANDNKPDCFVNPAIDKKIDDSETFGFGFLRDGSACNPTAETCNAVRAIILSTDNVDPIESGSVLFTCRFQVAAEVPNGTELPLDLSNAIGSDPAGQRLAGFTAASGVITIGAAVACVGDCNGNGVVTIGELQQGLNQFFGAPATDCFDVNGNGVISIGELQQGLNNFFTGCPS